ncbi:hypothetical protein Nepgr_000408 [Nepenthes gracilis]|uniref:Uncharacterized protein n=1 Tax=Nepenthes gracilis TaxID=150966 RepID=A0AAD3P6A7_NEPGR|nr:hypothetical protein Nepgr_000408 [Nepenthes gracilis]
MGFSRRGVLKSRTHREDMGPTKNPSQIDVKTVAVQIYESSTVDRTHIGVKVSQTGPTAHVRQREVREEACRFQWVPADSVGGSFGILCRHK